MFRTIVLAASLAFGMATQSLADSGQPMMYPLGNGDASAAQQELLTYIGESLTADPEGNAVIRGSSCTTPMDFLRVIREYHPNALIEEVGDLPGYIRSLQVRRADEAVPQGRYQMSRMICGTPGSGRLETDRVDSEEFSREFSLGEYVLFDNNIGEPVLAANCSNVVGAMEELLAPSLPALQSAVPQLETPWYEPCVFIPVVVREGAQYQWAHFLEDPIPAGNSQNCRVLCEGQILPDGQIGTKMATCIRAPRPCTDCDWGDQPVPRGFEVQDSAQWDAQWEITMIGVSREDLLEGGYFAICGYENRREHTGVPIFEPSELVPMAEFGYWNQGLVIPIWDGVSFRVGETIYTRDRQGRRRVINAPF